MFISCSYHFSVIFIRWCCTFITSLLSNNIKNLNENVLGVCDWVVRKCTFHPCPVSHLSFQCLWLWISKCVSRMTPYLLYPTTFQFNNSPGSSTLLWSIPCWYSTFLRMLHTFHCPTPVLLLALAACLSLS